MKILQRLFAMCAIVILAASCCGNSPKGAHSGAQSRGDAKYIFYFIGDGMSATQVRLAEAALTSEKFRANYAAKSGATAEVTSLNISKLGVTGLATTNAANRYITDSAAAGTALATGSKTDVGVISLDPQGDTLITIAQRAKESGMKVGVVSSVSIDHATPASFYAHNKSRNNYAAISDELLTSGFDYFAGGSPKWSSRARDLEITPTEAYQQYRQQAEAQGFKFITTLAEFNALHGMDKRPVIATIDMLANDSLVYGYDGYSLPYTLDIENHSADNRISLAQFTQKGIDLLDNKDGFFMMVEGGKIDWACHANDAATCAYEVVAFDEAIGVAMKFAQKHPDETLIVVTGDHDCGGLAIGFSGTFYESAFDILSLSNTSFAAFSYQARTKIADGESFESLLKFACEQFGLTNDLSKDGERRVVQTAELTDFEVEMLREAYSKSKSNKLEQADIFHNIYGGYDPFTTTCTKIINHKAGVNFSSFSHTAVPVMVFADGANANLFNGYYDNTDIAKRIVEAAGL